MTCIPMVALWPISNNTKELMNSIVKLMAMVVSIIAPPHLSGSMTCLVAYGYQGISLGNRRAPGANGAFRRAAAKARNG